MLKYGLVVVFSSSILMHCVFTSILDLCQQCILLPLCTVSYKFLGPPCSSPGWLWPHRQRPFLFYASTPLPVPMTPGPANICYLLPPFLHSTPFNLSLQYKHDPSLPASTCNPSSSHSSSLPANPYSISFTFKCNCTAQSTATILQFSSTSILDSPSKHPFYLLHRIYLARSKIKFFYPTATLLSLCLCLSDLASINTSLPLTHRQTSPILICHFLSKPIAQPFSLTSPFRW